MFFVSWSVSWLFAWNQYLCASLRFSKRAALHIILEKQKDFSENRSIISSDINRSWRTPITLVGRKLIAELKLKKFPQSTFVKQQLHGTIFLISQFGNGAAEILCSNAWRLNFIILLPHWISMVVSLKTNNHQHLTKCGPES